jgi:hypothetical protein
MLRLVDDRTAPGRIRQAAGNLGAWLWAFGNETCLEPGTNKGQAADSGGLCHSTFSATAMDRAHELDINSAKETIFYLVN